MIRNDIETQLAGGLRELADEPFTSAPLFDRIVAEARRRRRHHVTTISLAAILVVGGSVAAGNLLLRQDSTRMAAAAPTAAACPDTDTRSADNPPASDLGDQLVPAKPAVATICRYHGYNQPQAPGTLARWTTVRADRAASLADALNAGQRIPDGVYSCPADHAGTARVIFGYDDRTVTIWVELSGCPVSTNGVTELFTSPDLQQQLTKLVGQDPS